MTNQPPKKPWDIEPLLDLLGIENEETVEDGKGGYKLEFKLDGMDVELEVDPEENVFLLTAGEGSWSVTGSGNELPEVDGTEVSFELGDIRVDYYGHGASHGIPLEVNSNFHHNLTLTIEPDTVELPAV
mgnify:CR=1 FL=1